MEAHESDEQFHGFTHTEAATDGTGNCFLRHTYYPIEVVEWWNTRTILQSLSVEEIERVYREGWKTGYRSGVTDGGSDSSWCDEEGDWEKSEARAVLDTLGMAK
jgi:hypothetical protein